jgi:hypothetical protein
LQRQLHSWLGADLSAIYTADQKVDLRRLVGMHADVVLVHSGHNSKHNKPFVQVAVIKPYRTLIAAPLPTAA